MKSYFEVNASYYYKNISNTLLQWCVLNAVMCLKSSWTFMYRHVWLVTECSTDPFVTAFTEEKKASACISCLLGTIDFATGVNCNLHSVLDHISVCMCVCRLEAFSMDTC